MTSAQLMAAEAMHRALNLMPCGCLYNVPYAGSKVERVVTQQCARCRSMAAWQLATAEKAAPAKEQAS